MSFQLLATCPYTGARAGLLTTPHGELPTPAFMPVGTLATVKALTPRDLESIGGRCVLANTYHLALRPGAEVVEQLGGLHRFMGWQRPVLTDSGGFQIYSLAALNETDEQGVRFISHLDGRPVQLSPERVVKLQEQLGPDLMMPLDVCLPAHAPRASVQAALDRTRRWLVRSRAAQRRTDQLLFGIVQGGMFDDLRREAARDLSGLGLAGYAIGGLSVGEPPAVTARVLASTTPELPANRPRYVMGVGTPDQVVSYAGLGVDMFDCVLPTRLGRTGLAFHSEGRLNLKLRELAADPRPLDERCDCLTCSRYSRAFLHHSLRERQSLAARLLSLHNVRNVIRAAEGARAAILAGRFPEYLARFTRTAAAGDQLGSRQPLGVAS